MIVSYRVRLGLWEQRSASPQLGVWVRLSGWLSDLTSVSFRAFRFAKRWLVRDGQSGSGGKTQVKSVLHPGARDHFRRGPRAESLSKSEPAPNDDADSTSQGLLLGMRHYLRLYQDQRRLSYLRDAPPILFRLAEKECAAPGGRKRHWGAKRHVVPYLLMIRGFQQETAGKTFSRSVGRGPSSS